MVLFRAVRRRFGLQWLEFGIVRIMAVGTEKINPFPRAGKVSDPLSVKTGLPIFIDIPVAFATETIAFSEVNQISIIEPQLVPILGVMAIKTPSHCFSMMKFDVGVFVFQDSFLSVHLHGSVAIAAGEHPFGHRWRHIFLNDRQGRGSEKKQQKH